MPPTPSRPELTPITSRDKTVDPARRALARSYEYEEWPRERITFDRARDLFILYTDRKLLTPAMIARIQAHFHLPEERTEIQSDEHYQSTETPNGLVASFNEVERN